MTTYEPIEAWHFLNEDKRLRYNSNRLVRPGQTIKVKGKLSPCNWGLHASIKSTHALQYAPGPIICRVLCSSEIEEQDDKICARKRKCLWMADTTKVLQKFSLDCLELLLEYSNCKDQDIKNIDNYRNYFYGKINEDTYNSNCDFINENNNLYRSISDLIYSNSSNVLALSRQSFNQLSDLQKNYMSKHLEDLLWTLKP